MIGAFGSRPQSASRLSKSGAWAHALQLLGKHLQTSWNLEAHWLQHFDISMLSKCSQDCTALAHVQADAMLP